MSSTGRDANSGHADSRVPDEPPSRSVHEISSQHKTGHVSVSDARHDFAELVNRVAYGHERVVVARRGRAIAAIVPIEDVELLERLEDEVDLEAARAALTDPEGKTEIPWDQVKT